MTTNIKYSIHHFLQESTHFNSNDVLIHVENEHKKAIQSDLLSFDLNFFPKTILREAKKFKKESGINTLSRSVGTLEHLYDGNEICTPIILYPLEFKIDKIKNKIYFSFDDTEWFINPFLQKHISSSIEKDFPNFNNIEDVFSFLNDIGLTAINASSFFIGNFHHHRFQIIKELDDLTKCTDLNENLKILLGNNDVSNISGLKFDETRLLSADVDHEKVFENLENGNCVVQGPPGTGKSQVLTNVLANNLSHEATTIVVSEKRVALEVLVKKMKKFNLDKLCFISTSDKLSRSFLIELKSTWDYFDSLETDHRVHLGLSKQYEDHLQMTLDFLNQNEIVGGVSFSKFHSISSRFPKWDRVNYSSVAPTISNVIENEEFIQNTYAKNASKIVGFIRPNVFESDSFLTIDTKLKSLKKLLNKITVNLSVSTFEDLRELMKLAIDCQVYENENYKKYAQIFKINSRVQKRFLSLRKKYLKLKSEMDLISKNLSHWKVVPSEIETKSLLVDFKKGGFFKRFRTIKRWKEISTLPHEKAIETLEHHLQNIDKDNKFSKILIDFCEIGIESPEKEIDLIHQTLIQFSIEKWSELEEIPLERRQVLTAIHNDLNTLFSEIHSLFDFDDTVCLEAYFASFLLHFEDLIFLKSEIVRPEKELFKLLRYADDYQTFWNYTLKSNWVKFKDQFPAFSSFKISDLTDKISAVIHQQNEESFLFAKAIEMRIKKRFDEYHLLLQTPARKLSEKDKKKKAILRKGKSLLIKEFSKTRNHPSLRELYDSEARIWIQLLKPIWLSNPTQLSKCFPLSKDLFDLAIFDEASQIPLQNALGTIQRSKQILVAGDEFQMGPSSFFQKGEDEVVDLLHQANYYFPKIHLHHHYRSTHPDLIAFSNKHFYNNELMVFPSYASEVPLHHHFVENGIFKNRKNVIESEKIAQGISAHIRRNESIGVVAFSEEQLNCIWSYLENDVQQKLSNHLANNRGFFKSLENVQGDECDHLFISFGYAKNELGEFHLRFGPMNKSNGRKRLNVLLTRSKKSIHFYCSVRSSDFKLTDNENIQLIKKWIAFSENYKINENIIFPFNLEAKLNENRVEFEDVHQKISSAKELVTLHQVLENRGWDVSYR